jgi:hypothetical protein
MNQSLPPKSRLQLVREQGARGHLRDDVIQRTRLVVSIDRLAEDPNNERKTLNNIEEMVASLKAHGIIEPITVVALDDGRYQIVTGHRRYRAAKLAGLGQMEILVRQPEDDSRRRIKSLISNIQRESVPPLELALAIKTLLGALVSVLTNRHDECPPHMSRGRGLRQRQDQPLETRSKANPGAIQTELGRALGVKRANMVPLIAGLEGRGLVQRRQRLLQLSALRIPKMDRSVGSPLDQPLAAAGDPNDVFTRLDFQSKGAGQYREFVHLDWARRVIGGILFFSDAGEEGLVGGEARHRDGH